eukprot:COSAG06_NODE_9192_length_1961_cov_9.274973_2_plen_152_part_00
MRRGTISRLKRKKDGKPPSNATDVKWSNADESADNDVPPEFYKACPFSFSKKHPISDLLDNYIPSADTESYISWFQVDDGSEARFETMGEQLDPNGAEMQMQSVHSLCCISAARVSRLALLMHSAVRGPFHLQALERVSAGCRIVARAPLC